MSADAPTPADVQADALIDSIERQVTAQLHALHAGTAREAAEIRARARVKARRQLRRAVEQMRASENRQQQQLRAELDTTTRREAAARAQGALAMAWPRLPAALTRAWGDAAVRARWVDAQLAQARERLVATAWVVRHPAVFNAHERHDLEQRLAGHGRPDATLEPDEALPAGLVIEADGARLASSPAAWLADRPAIESALLAALAREEAQAANHATPAQEGANEAKGANGG